LTPNAAPASTLVQQAAANQLDDWTESPRSMLALILLLDQMPRNIYAIPASLRLR
jgi:uncharacterized protein (DUF924 family)